MPGYKRKRSIRNNRRTRRRIFRAPRPMRSNSTHMFKRVVELEPKVAVIDPSIDSIVFFQQEDVEV